MAAGGEKDKKRIKKKEKVKEVSVPTASEPENKGTLPKRSQAARSGDAIRVSVKDV